MPSSPLVVNQYLVPKRPTLFVTHLSRGAENVGIILLEAPDTGESMEGTGVLVAVQRSKVREANRQLPIRPFLVRKHYAVRRTVHGLEAKVRLFHVDKEHVLLVMVGVSTGAPQVYIKHVGSYHFFIFVLPVFFLQMDTG